MDSSRFVDSGKYVGDAQGCHITGYQRRDCFGASANEEGDKHDAAAGSLLAAISAASRVPGLFAPSQFRWERPEREPSRRFHQGRSQFRLVALILGARPTIDQDIAE